jgi:PAS domain S-box-containing protein
VTPPRKRCTRSATAAPPADPNPLSGLADAPGVPAPHSDWLRCILDSLTDGVVVTDHSGRFLVFNPAAARILGVGALDIPASEWSAIYGCFRSDMITPFPAEELPLARALTGETVDGEEIFIRNPNRPEGAWITISGAPVRGNDGSVQGAVVVFHDVTQQRAEIQTIRHLSNAVEQTADSVVITDHNGLITYVNPAFEKMSGYRRQEALGRTPSFLKSGKHDREFYRSMWRTLLAGRVFQETLLNRRKNGQLYLGEQTITPMRDAGGQISHFVSVGKDVTELRRAAEVENKLALAREVQQRLYPATAPALPGFDLAGAAYPADATGGDYYDFIPLPDGRLAIAIGDVSGHGFDAALFMVEARAYLRSAAQEHSDAGRLLSRLNQLMIDDIPVDRFVTLLLGVLDPAAGTLQFASAGHTPGYVLRPSGAIKRVLKATGAPLGLVKNVPYENSEIVRLDPGDMIALLTDGVTEALSPRGAFFGDRRTLKSIRRHLAGSARDIVSGLYQDVCEFGGGRHREDDITAVICKRQPAAVLS